VLLRSPFDVVYGVVGFGIEIIAVDAIADDRIIGRTGSRRPAPP
jgi:hypothetical protein